MKDTEHYFSTDAGKPDRLGKVVLHHRGREIELVTSDRVFSYRRVDKGTLLLIDEMELPEGGLVLDLGCGYGALMVCASISGSRVVGVDVNARAVWLAGENLRRHAAGEWLVMRGDLYSPFARHVFDSVVSNPPIRAGREVVARIIGLAPKYLRNGGSLQIVARTRMGAKPLSSLMRESFGNVLEVGKRSGYRVLLSRRRGGRVD